MRPVSTVDMYTRRLERAVIEAQGILVRAIDPHGISDELAMREVLAVLDDPGLLNSMVLNGALERHPDAVLLRIRPYRENR